MSTIGGTILWAVLESSPLAVVLPNLCNVASFEKDRLRAIAFRVLGLYCTRYLEGQVNAVKRYVIVVVRNSKTHAHKHTLRTWHPTLYPCVTHFHLQLNQESVPLLSPHCRSAFPAVCQALCTASLKPDVRVAAIESLRLIQTMTRDSVWCWTENQLHQQELKRILI